MTVSSGGSKTGELRYSAYGGTRYTWGTTPTTYRYTGQRQEESLGLYFYNARWYDPYLNRWVQLDTIVPQPGNPQDLNRFSYARNNPLKYTDPTGHIVWFAPMLVGAGVGALTGATISYGLQVWTNRQAGMSWQEAALNVDVGKVAGAAGAGAIMGGTFGVVGAVGGFAALGIGGSMAVGAASSAVAGQVEPLVAATANEAIDWYRNHGDFSGADILHSAKSAGFLDPTRIAIDTASGAFAGGVAYGASAALTSVAQSYGLLDQTLTCNPMWKLQYLPGGTLTAYTGRTSVTIPRTVFDAYLVVLAEKGPEFAARWLFNQTDKLMTGTLNEANNENSP